MKVTATLLKFGEDTIPDMFGDVVAFAADSLFTDEHQAVPLLVQTHDQGKIAAGYATAVYVEGDLVKGDFEILPTMNGQQAAIELQHGVRWDVSIGVRIVASSTEKLDPADESWLAPSRMTIESADLFEVSLCFRGRMPSARVDAVSTDPTEGATA